MRPAEGQFSHSRLALFLPWSIAQDEETLEKSYLGAFDYEETSHGESIYPDTFRVSVTIFLIGTIIAFITPIGGVFQLVGSLGFILAASTTQFDGFVSVWWVGSGVGLAAAVAVLISLAVPVGKGYGHQKGFGISRLIAWTVYR